MNNSRAAGSALIGFILGLVVGLAVAVAAALYITHAPAPLVNKVKPPSETVNPAAAAGGDLPDPNKPLYAAPRPDTVKGADSASGPPRAPGTLQPAPGPAAAASSLTATPDKPADGMIAETTRYVLQAGAYHSADDADAIRARLALLGMDAKVVPRDQDGTTLYRVRLGPYGRVEEIDKIRQILATNGIDAQIVTLK
jgi:cell division protein FtsN